MKHDRKDKVIGIWNNYTQQPNYNRTNAVIELIEAMINNINQIKYSSDQEYDLYAQDCLLESLTELLEIIKNK